MQSRDFREVMSQSSDGDLLDLCLLGDGVPFVTSSQESWNSFRDSLVNMLPIKHGDIRIVGSARLGFSMKPRNNLRRFQDTSDIDVVIVNDLLFDWLWVALLTAAYPRSALFRGAGGWSEAGRSELFAGWLTPHLVRLDYRILGARAAPILEFKTTWFNALKEAARHPTRRHQDINGRLYRTWKHAELYHLHSLAELRKSLFGALT
jgi:hypothetical protein